MVRRKKEQKKNGIVWNWYNGKKKKKKRKKRLFLLLCDLETCDVSRPINKKEKSMCYTLCRFSITYD